MPFFKKKIERYLAFGLDGIECYYPTHTEEITKLCLEICKEKNLLITAGSDCHGEFGKAQIGEMNVRLENLYLGELLG